MFSMNVFAVTVGERDFNYYYYYYYYYFTGLVWVVRDSGYIGWRFGVAVTRWSRTTQLLYIEPG